MSNAQKREPEPNKGMNTRVFMIVVLVAAVLIGIVLLAVVAKSGRKLEPSPGTRHPTSRLVMQTGPVWS